jgi:phosphomevalonate kinase
MVKMVQTWKRSLSEDEVDTSPWGKLAVLNASVSLQLRTLLQLQNDGMYEEALREVQDTPADQWKRSSNAVTLRFWRLREDFLDIREQLREMGRLASGGKESFIEPPDQTALADATMALPGVLVAGVPGAGGHDAIFALVFRSKARERTRTLWDSRGVTTLLLQEEQHGVLIHSTVPGSRL